MAHTSPNYRSLVHTPAELAGSFVQWAERIQQDPGITWGVPAIDKRVIPMRPGELVGLIGRPGHAKTSLLAYFAREEAKRIQARGKAETEAVVYVTWEQSAEELEAFFQTDTRDGHSITDIAWGRVNLAALTTRAIKRVHVPIWIVGHGIGRAGQNMPRMTPDVILGAIETMQEDFGVSPALMLFDYIQLIPVRRAQNRMQQVTEVVILIKELALRVGAPALVGVQASRDVDTRDVKIPGKRDCQWASSIEQTADKLFGLWRPGQTEEPGAVLELGGRHYRVDDRLLIIRMLKQRGDRGTATWGMYFDPARLTLGEMQEGGDD